MSMLVLGLEAYFAALLGVAGFAKVHQRQQFALTLRQQRILPHWSIPLIALILPWGELLIAELLIVGIAKALTAGIVLTLFLSFLVFKLILMVSQPKADCGCSGASQAQPVDNASIVVATIFVLLAGLHLWGIASFPSQVMLLES
jgi:hypothetical protein